MNAKINSYFMVVSDKLLDVQLLSTDYLMKTIITALMIVSLYLFSSFNVNAATITCTGTETIGNISYIHYDQSAGTCSISDASPTTAIGDIGLRTRPDTREIYFYPDNNLDGLLTSIDHMACTIGDNENINAGASCVASGMSSGTYTNEVTSMITAVTKATMSVTYDYVNGTSFNITSASVVTSEAVSPTVTFSPTNGATGVSDSGNITITFNEAVRNIDDSALTDANVDGRITLKSTNASGADIPFDATIDAAKEVITINPSSNFSSEQVVYVSIDADVEDSADNAITTSNATFTVVDTASPTVTFSPTDGATGVSDSGNITITFNEAVRNIDDSALTDANVDGRITLKSTNASGADIPFDATIDAAKEVITINPSSNFSSEQVVYVSIDADVEDSADNAITTSNATFSVLISPLRKQDVVASVETMSNISFRWAENSISPVQDRLKWLRRNKGSEQLSHQGINLEFRNKLLNQVMNGQSREGVQIADLSEMGASKALELLQSTDNMPERAKDEISAGVTQIALNEAVKLREDAVGTLNPSFGVVLDDWSMWTSGQITIGENEATFSSAKQDIEAGVVSFGMDKPVEGGVYGLATSIGQDRVDIGTSTSKVESDNYSLSAYRVFEQEESGAIEGMIGLGHLQFDTTRKDGSETLSGNRDANQVYASVTYRQANIEHEKFSISPYGSLMLSRTTLDQFSESGGGNALTYKEQTINDSKLSIGADIDYLIHIANGKIKPYGSIEYSADISSSSSADMHYNSETTTIYTLNLDKKAKSQWKIGLGANILTKNGWTSSVDYERTQSINAGHSDSISLNIALQF